MEKDPNIPVLDVPNEDDSEVGFFRGDLNVRSPQPEERSPLDGEFPNTEISTFPTNTLQNNSMSARSSMGWTPQRSPQVEEKFPESRRRILNKLEAVDALLNRAVELQHQLEKMDDPETKKSVDEKVDKMRNQKFRLEEELDELEKLESWKASCTLALSMPPPPVHNQQLAETVDSLLEKSTRPFMASGESNGKETGKSKQNSLTDSIKILKGNLDEILERKQELSAMVNMLYSKQKSAVDGEEQLRFYRLIERHTERISELDQTIDQAKNTLSAMMEMNRNNEPIAVPRDSESDEEDETVDVAQMQALRARLNKLRGKANFVDMEQANEDNFMSEQNIQNRRKSSTITLRGEESRKQQSRSDQLADSTKQHEGPDHPELNNAPGSRNASGRYSLADWSQLRPSAPPPKRQAVPEAKVVGNFAYHPHVQQMLEMSSDLGQSAYPYMAFDSDYSDADNESFHSLNPIRNPVDPFAFDKRNDLTGPPKKKSNWINWKNGSRGDGWLRAEREHRHQDLLNQAPSWPTANFRAEQTDNFRELAVPDVIDSLQVMMTEQQKILNTCVQFIAKPRSDDSQFGGKFNPSRDIPIINNASRFRGAERSQMRRNESRCSEYEPSNMLNNQRLEAPQYSSRNARAQEAAEESRDHYEQERQPRNNRSGTYRLGDTSDVVCAPRLQPRQPKKKDGQKQLAYQIARVTEVWADDIGSLHYILDSLSTLDSSVLRATVAAKIGLLAINERTAATSPVLPQAAAKSAENNLVGASMPIDFRGSGMSMPIDVRGSGASMPIDVRGLGVASTQRLPSAKSAVQQISFDAARAAVPQRIFAPAAGWQLPNVRPLIDQVKPNAQPVPSPNSISAGFGGNPTFGPYNPSHGFGPIAPSKHRSFSTPNYLDPSSKEYAPNQNIIWNPYVAPNSAAAVNSNPYPAPYPLFLASTSTAMPRQLTGSLPEEIPAAANNLTESDGNQKLNDLTIDALKESLGRSPTEHKSAPKKAEKEKSAARKTEKERSAPKKTESEAEHSNGSYDLVEDAVSAEHKELAED